MAAPSPFEELIDEFSELDGRDLEHIAVVAVTMAIAAGIAAWLRRRDPAAREPGAVGAWRYALFYGVSFPLLTCLFLAAFRLTAHGAASGVLPRLAVPVFASLAAVRAVARVLRRLFPQAPSARAVINAISVLVWMAVVTHIAGVLPAIEAELEALTLPIGKAQVSLLTLVQGVVLVAIALLAALWLSALLESRLMATTIHMSVRLVLTRLLRATLFVLALLIALSAVGIDLTVLSVFGGALGVGLGLGLQKIAANYVSGFAMLLERSFRVGDVVKIDGFEGEITNIHTRYTVVRAPNGRESVVPNEMFVINRVENLTLETPRVAFSTKVQVGYESDIELARSLMIDAALAQPRVLRDPRPSVQLTEFAADGIELTLAFWLADPANGIGNVRSEINLALWRAFKANGIDVPYPQRVVRIVPTAGTSPTPPPAQPIGREP